MTEKKRKLKYLLTEVIDTVYNNGNPIYLDIRSFLLDQDRQMNKTKVDFLISAILSTGFVEPVKEFDADIEEYYDTGELKMTNQGMSEMLVYDSFIKFWYSPRQRLKRLSIIISTPILFIIKNLKNSVNLINTISTITLSFVTAFLLIKADKKDTKVEQITKDKNSLILTLDSLNTLIIQQQDKIQTLNFKDSVQNIKTFSE